MQESEFDVIILGAGASGLFCAATAGARGKKVLLLDHGPKPARKVLISGGGKCNLTNKNISFEDYHGENPQFARSALSRFSPTAFMQLLENNGIALEEREEGQIFCKRTSKDLANFLFRQCETHNCRFVLNAKIISISAQRALPVCFTVKSTQGRYSAPSLVVATGGPAYPDVGATGFGYTVARQFGHKVIPPRPALAGLNLSPESPFTALSGISLRVNVTLENSGQERLVAQNLPLLFTHKGLSGPAALQASLFWEQGAELKINWLPEVSLQEALKNPGKVLTINLLKKFLPERLGQILVQPETGRAKAAELSKKQRQAVIEAVHSFKLTPKGVQSLARAEVTAGGVDTSQVSSKTMESVLQPGLYFCGEVLDITGRLGGYNLHWAFASGRAVGEFI